MIIHAKSIIILKKCNLDCFGRLDTAEGIRLVLDEINRLHTEIGIHERINEILVNFTNKDGVEKNKDLILGDKIKIIIKYWR